MCVLKAGGHILGVPGKGKKNADAMNREERRALPPDCASH
jgi:hypothetical protein